MSADETLVVHAIQLDVLVDYHQTYLVDEGCSAGRIYDAPSSHPVGIIQLGEGTALLTVGLQWGTMGFTVAVANGDPGADFDGYEDIVEISYESPSGRVFLEEWGGGKAHALPPLPAGPGTYRLRYHARGMDEESQDEIDERYLLQIWPQPRCDPAVLKSTSQLFEYWLSSERSR
jgi:hypothetical protein